MTDTDSTDLGEKFEVTRDSIEAAVEETDGDSLPDDRRDEVGEHVEELADAVSAASLGELLDTAGFEGVPEDASPPDLPMLMKDAPTDAVLRLRRLVKTAEVGGEWSDLDGEARLERLESTVRDESKPAEEEEESRGLGDLLSDVWSVGDEGSGELSETSEPSEPSEPSGDGTDDDTERTDGTDDQGLAAFHEKIDRLRTVLESASERMETEESEEEKEESEDEGLIDGPDFVGDESQEEEEEEEEGGRRAPTGSGSRFSTMPSSRLGMGRSTRFSSVRGRK
jgi:hypothetical protein